MALFEHAIALQPQCVVAHTNRGLVLRKLLGADLAEALAADERAVALQPNAPTACCVGLLALRGLPVRVAEIVSKRGGRWIRKGAHSRADARCAACVRGC